MRTKLRKEQIKDWSENPVTREAVWICLAQIAKAEQAILQSFYPFEPQKTQEFLAIFNTNIADWQDFHQVLRGEWDDFMEEEDEVSEIGSDAE